MGHERRHPRSSCRCHHRHSRLCQAWRPMGSQSSHNVSSAKVNLLTSISFNLQHVHCHWPHSWAHIDRTWLLHRWDWSKGSPLIHIRVRHKPNPRKELEVLHIWSIKFLIIISFINGQTWTRSWAAFEFCLSSPSHSLIPLWIRCWISALTWAMIRSQISRSLSPILFEISIGTSILGWNRSVYSEPILSCVSLMHSRWTYCLKLKFNIWNKIKLYLLALLIHQ